MGVNGKQKGNAFERKIANTLSERFADYTGIEKAFRRNPDSGSFFGGSNKDRKDIYDTEWAIYGDLICPRNFNFSVECKHYKDAPKFTALLKQKVSDWDEWIEQARQDAEESGKEMMLIIKYNNTDIFTFTDPHVMQTDYILEYNGARIRLLEHVLEQDNSFFFEENEEE